MSRNFALAICLSILYHFSCISQDLSISDKIVITDALTGLLKENYVLQDSVAYIIPKIKESHNTDEFRREQSHKEFSLYLTKVLREITKDAHFGFLYNPQLSAMLSGPPGEDIEALNQQLNAIGGGSAGPSSKENFYFKKAEVLDGNVGYLKLERMAPLEESKATLNAAMAFLAHSDIFILDLRGNRGGSGGFIPYLMSYFFPDEEVLLYRREMPAPAWDSISYHYTYQNLPGKRLDDVSLFILTDQTTGSAATNLAYTMQNFGKATIIGENTGAGYRGAHSASLFSLPNGFVGLIPIGRVVNAKTNTNWRELGVIPDIKTKSSEALDRAYLLALEELIEAASDDQSIAELKSIYEEKSNPENEKNSIAKRKNFEKYVGAYEGGRTVWVEDNQLKYMREGGSPLNLKFKDEHLYKITLPSNSRSNQSLPSVKFSFGKNDEVDYITLVFDDGKNTQGPFKKLPR